MLGRMFKAGMSRSRWSAIGAAVAVSVGAGGLFVAHAAVSSDPSVFHALSPVRVFDTRLGTGGVAATPLLPDSTLEIQMTGINGVPVDATAVVLNVTVVNGTASSFLTAWPTGEARPLASSINWTTPEARPNGVTVPVGVGGKVSFYNLTGSVDVLADVAGYYTPADPPPFTAVVAQTVGASSLGSALNQISSVSITLPDACPGADSWSVLVHADGYFLTGGNSAGVASATIALGLAPTNFTDGTVINQNFESTTQWRESYATTFMYTVDSGTTTFFELGSTNHPQGVSAGQNNLIAQAVSVSC